MNPLVRGVDLGGLEPPASSLSVIHSIHFFLDVFGSTDIKCR